MNTQAVPQVLVPRQEIHVLVRTLAARISADYRDSHPLLIGALKGCFMFMADLVRCLDFPLEIEFVRLSSYENGTESSGKIRLVQGLRAGIAGRHVLVVEDIIDTGLTVSFLLDYLREQGPASVRCCTLLDKPARRRCQVCADYVGLEVPDRFLVGYGLDCDEKYRNLPDICYLEE
jgi:hypoxanthine phosphoribosyltransferase